MNLYDKINKLPKEDQATFGIIVDSLLNISMKQHPEVSKREKEVADNLSFILNEIKDAEMFAKECLNDKSQWEENVFTTSRIELEGYVRGLQEAKTFFDYCNFSENQNTLHKALNCAKLALAEYLEAVKTQNTDFLCEENLEADIEAINKVLNQKNDTRDN